jgi:phosphotriesterase-related protein
MEPEAPTDFALVRTVCGDILPEDVGLAHCHEHAFILPGPSSRVNPSLLLDDLEKTSAELHEFHAAGGRTIVDAQPIGQERAPTLQRLASQRSGVHVVAATGFHRGVYYDADHFRFRESAAALAARMIAEIVDGMAEYRGPEVVRTTDVRAGILKFASDYRAIDAQAEKVLEAVAIAHCRTGAPILTHTEQGTCALQQIGLFRKHGVHPSALLISHVDRNPDSSLHEEIAGAGAYLVYDGISRVKYHSDSTIVHLICRMAEAGRASQVLLGMDMGPRTMWRSYGGGPGMTYLANVFLPSLRKAGLGHQQIAMLTELNPAKALQFRPRSG